MNPIPWMDMGIAFVVGFLCGMLFNQWRRTYHPGDRYEDDKKGDGKG